jgi:SAM-dependent methyltransferase
MVFDEAALLHLYRETAEDYNRTELATDMGFRFVPNDFTLMQLRHIVKHLPGPEATFVDIGTGMGIAPRFVKKLGIRSISVDFPATGGLAGIETVREAGVEGYYCEVGREPIPLEAESADLVLMADVIEHLTHSPKPVLEEIKRLLKPQGICLATTPNATRLAVRVKVAMGFSNWPYVFDYYDKDFHDGHHHEFTRRELQGVFQKSGFIEEDFILYEKSLRHVQVFGLYDLDSKNRHGDQQAEKSPFYIRVGKYLLLQVTNLAPGLRSEMMIVARKP